MKNYVYSKAFFDKFSRPELPQIHIGKPEYNKTFFNKPELPRIDVAKPEYSKTFFSRLELPRIDVAKHESELKEGISTSEIIKFLNLKMEELEKINIERRAKV